MAALFWVGRALGREELRQPMAPEQALVEELRDFLQSFDEPPRAPLRSHPGRHVAREPLPEALAHLGWRPKQQREVEPAVGRQQGPEPGLLGVPAQVSQPPAVPAALTSRGELPELWKLLPNPRVAPEPPERRQLSTQLERPALQESSESICPEGFAGFSGEAPHGLLSGRGYRFRGRLVWWRRQPRRQPAGFSKSAYRPFTSNTQRMQHVNSLNKFAHPSASQAGLGLQHIATAPKCEKPTRSGGCQCQGRRTRSICSHQGSNLKQ